MEKYIILGLNETGAWVLLIGVVLYAVLITVFYILNRAGSMAEIDSLLMLIQELKSENKAPRKASNLDATDERKGATEC